MPNLEYSLPYQEKNKLFCDSVKYLTTTFIGTYLRRNFTPCSSMCSPARLAMSWSKPLSRMDRTMTVTSRPSPAKKPPHSRATYEAPITRVFPGQYDNEKRSSLVEKQTDTREIKQGGGKTSGCGALQCLFVSRHYTPFYCEHRPLDLNQHVL